jgi:hypothetical protein
LLALLGAHPIFHVSRIRVKKSITIVKVENSKNKQGMSKTCKK